MTLPFLSQQGTLSHSQVYSEKGTGSIDLKAIHDQQMEVWILYQKTNWISSKKNFIFISLQSAPAVLSAQQA